MPQYKKRKYASGRAPRPIDKTLIYLNRTLPSGSQDAATVYTANVPCTLSGFQFTPDQSERTYWALVLVEDGYTVSTLNFADLSNWYEPEQNVLMHGLGLSGSTQAVTVRSKTQRKLKVGDTLVMVQRNSGGTDTRGDGVLQFFCKV